MKKTAKVKVAFEGTDRRNEFRMKSPTGRVVTLHCNGKWNLMSPELHRLIMKYRFCGMTRPCFTPWGDRPEHEEVVTYNLMLELLELAA